MTGRIHSFQSLGTVDGPGVRSVVFMQGCPLRCPFCHNPDTWDTSSGTEVTVPELIKKISRFREYYGEEGGVTVSGGEPLLQAGFVAELFSALHEQGINTALDTSGCLINSHTEPLLGQTDTVLLDIKFSTGTEYRKYIGIPLSKPLEFLSLCEKLGKSVIIRQVITPGINDTEENIKKLKSHLAGFSCIKKAELLPFRTLCREKYETLGIPFPFGDRPDMSDERIAELEELMKK